LVIDSSAVVAILLEEPEAGVFAKAIAADTVRLMSAVSAFEAAIVIEARKGEAGGREFDLLLHRARIELVPFRAEHLELTRWAWRRFGKGRHSAGLNLGDCFSYAPAKSLGEPLLFKGNDFSRTDIRGCI
jgi:ribonuclease VapC